ncbi:hypothetical protein BGX27_004937, partial [Mortierella sp. AM989]
TMRMRLWRRQCWRDTRLIGFWIIVERMMTWSFWFSGKVSMSLRQHGRLCSISTTNSASKTIGRSKSAF